VGTVGDARKMPFPPYTAIAAKLDEPRLFLIEDRLAREKRRDIAESGQRLTQRRRPAAEAIRSAA